MSIPLLWPGSMDPRPTRGPNMDDPPTITEIIDFLLDYLVASEREHGTNPKGSASSIRARFEGIENGSRISALAASKLTGSGGTLEMPGHVYTTGNISADGIIHAADYMRAGNGSGNPQFALMQTGGTFPAGVTLTSTTHNIFNAPGKVLHATAGYKGSGGQWVRINTVYIDGSHIYMDATGQTTLGGAAGRPYLASIMYTPNAAAGW